MTAATVYVIDADVIKHQSFAAKQFILTLYLPEIANNSKPGQFIHLQCSRTLLMRRPMSIMTINKSRGTVDLLYKVVGYGTALLSQVKIGEQLAVIGPIGKPFTLSVKKRPLLLGGGVGMPPVIALAQSMQQQHNYKPIAILASEVPFPFHLIKSQQSRIHHHCSKTMPLFKKWGIPCALSSLKGFAGGYQGYITDLAKYYLETLSASELAEVEIFSCGPEAMLKAVADLAQQYCLKAQLSLEEYMACALGGCAGCTVLVKEARQFSMKRVCVDGPVFAADTVFYD